ncbi:hypothetical protein N7475_005094 [Penicillium sp. IBT 31633x]|nr:hypothetical protein N7475_005094 [Penicillium sp. IBT 31633x]
MRENLEIARLPRNEKAAGASSLQTAHVLFTSISSLLSHFSIHPSRSPPYSNFALVFSFLYSASL